jgi:hypothetical protein
MVENGVHWIGENGVPQSADVIRATEEGESENPPDVRPDSSEGI